VSDLQQRVVSTRGQLVARILDNVRPLLNPGERLQYAFTGQTGVNPDLLWLPLLRWLVITNRARIVAVTDQRIAVFAAGQLRWQRQVPRNYLYSLPRNSHLVHGAGAWSRITVGAEQIWFSRAAYNYLDEINNATAGSVTAAVPGWYSQPGSGLGLRWWDGHFWTDAVVDQ